MLSGSASAFYLGFSCLAFYISAVLFGAPLFSDITSSLILAILLSSATTLLLILVVKSEERLFELITSYYNSQPNYKEDLVLHSAVFSIVGCLIASVVYPLDWDRWWQRYPLPNIIGTIGGSLIGVIYKITCSWKTTFGAGPYATGDADGRFGKYDINDVPKLLGMFFAEFDNQVGPKIKYQIPNNFVAKNIFSQNSHLIITKPQLFCKSIKISLRKERYKILGYPIGLDHKKYGRGRYSFNMCFVLPWDSISDSMYEPIVQKAAEYLIEFEQEFWFLTDAQYEEKLYGVMEKMFEDLNSKGESVVEIKADEQIMTMYFKLCPSYRGIEPPEVSIYMVPMFIREVELTERLIEKMDVLSQKIIPRIDGVKTVKEIGKMLELDPSLVARCVRNLHFYECVSLVPMFLYSNTYVATERVHDFYTNQTEITDCLEFVKIQSIRTRDGSELTTPLPEFSDVFRLYLSMKCGMKLSDWMKEENPRSMGIDEHRLVQFGMHHQFLRKLTIYPICTVSTAGNKCVFQIITKFQMFLSDSFPHATVKLHWRNSPWSIIWIQIECTSFSKKAKNSSLS